MAGNFESYAVATSTLAGTSIMKASNSDHQPTIVAATKSLDLETPVTVDGQLKPTDETPLGPNIEVATNESGSTIAEKASESITIESLPNELLSHIFSFLDIVPPSADTKDLIDEPKFDLTDAATANLKASSCVSKLWRKAILPKLFRHTRFRVKTPEPKMPIRHLETEIRPFLEFVKKNTLSQIITTFVLAVNDRSILGDEVVPEHKLDHFADFWRSLFRTIDPVELLVIAHPQFLGRLTSCHVYAVDNWNFDCPCHYLRLRRPAILPKQPSTSYEPDSSSGNAHAGDELATSIVSVDNVPGDSSEHGSAPSITNDSAESSEGPTDSTPETSASGSGRPFDTELEPWQILHPQASVLFEIRPWCSILLNEGSFIKAYSTYEFWLRQAPSILSDMVGADDQPSGALISPTIREMEYIGIFPMASHFSSLTRHLPRLDRLYVQLVPRNDILGDSAKMAQVEMEDLWMERNSCYALLMRELFNTPPMDNYKYLQVFESGDAADTDAWHMAVEYVKRAGNGWKVAGDGIFERSPEDLTPEPEDGAEAEDPSSLSVN